MTNGVIRSDARCLQVLVPRECCQGTRRVAWPFHECCPPNPDLLARLQNAGDHTLERDFGYLFQFCAGPVFSGIPQVKHTNHHNFLPSIHFSKQCSLVTSYRVISQHSVFYWLIILSLPILLTLHAQSFSSLESVVSRVGAL